MWDGEMLPEALHVDPEARLDELVVVVVRVPGVELPVERKAPFRVLLLLEREKYGTVLQPDRSQPPFEVCEELAMAGG